MLQQIRLFFIRIPRRHVVVGVILTVLVSFGLYLNYTSAATITLVPSSTVSNDWTVVTGCTAAAGHSCIDEGATSSTSDYISTGLGLDAAAVSGTFGIANTTQVSTVTELKVYIYAQSASLGSAADSVTADLKLNGVSAGTPLTQTMTTSYSLYSVTYTGNWTQSDVNNMQLVLSRNILGTGPGSSRDDDVRIANAYVSMTYTAPVSISLDAYRWFGGEKTRAAGVFNPDVEYATSTNPRGVVSGDFNGDQNIDVVSSNVATDTVSVLLGNGDGTFDAKVDYTTGDGPDGIVTGDFNGDQAMDVITANLNGANISVLLGNGDGTFDVKVDYATQTAAAYLTIGDVNNDQITDLVSSGGVLSTYSVLLGNSDGTFDSAVHYAGSGFKQATLADLNNDQKNDLIVGNVNTNAVSVLLGNGDGTFGAKVDYPATSATYAVAAGDFNNDQKIDIVSGSSSNTSISVLLGNGDGTLGAKVDYPAGTGTSGLQVLDLNGDNSVDIVSAIENDADAAVAVLKGNGNGTFRAKINYAAGGDPTATASGDANGDGAVDLFVANYAGSTISVLINTLDYPALSGTNIAAKTPADGSNFRLRFNLGVSDASLSSASFFKLRYQEKSGSCSTNPMTYVDVTSSSPIRFYDDVSLADHSAYIATDLDPVVPGTTVGQTYDESNAFSSVSTLFAGYHGLWDLSLAAEPGLTPGAVYCLIVTKSDNSALNSYPVIPEIIIPSPAQEQSNYRFYQNINSLTPGAPLAPQNTKPNVTVGSAFRLRQLLRQTNDTSPVGASFKLQAAEKISTCSAASFITLSDGVGDAPVQSTGFQQTANTITGDIDTFGNQWSSPMDAKLDDDVFATSFFISGSKGSAPLNPSNYGFSIPSNATIAGIEFQYQVGAAARQSVRFLQVKKGSTSSDNRTHLGAISPGATYTVGGSSDLWGLTWTPADINSPTFGATYATTVTGTSGTISLTIDYMALNVHYSVPGVSSFIDNVSISDEATINSFANDPTPASGAVRMQTYSENQNFSVVNSMQNGENGLWDFALLADESLTGKTYCFRVIKDDNTPLANYAQYPEVTFTSAGPTLSQQLRGGQSVVNGVKRPFNW